MSLLESIAQTDKFIYEKLSLKTIDAVIDKVFNKPEEQKNSWVFYTGLLGYIASEVYFYEAFLPDFPKVYIQPVKKGKYHIVVSVYSKSGLYKCYIDGMGKVYVKKGTTLLTTFEQLTPEIFRFIKKHKK